jgi:3-phosphoshikimate 1-carboxyvinyltransferase
MLRAFGADVEVTPLDEGWRVALGARRALTGAEVDVPGDPSSAAFAWVAALIVPRSEVVTPNVMINPLRTGLLATLREMGGQIELRNERESGGERIADVVVRASRLRGVAVPAARAPAMIDEYPLLGVAAAFADGATVMNGLHELRVKESDRFQAILDGLAACGVEVAANGDSLEVRGGAGAVRGGGRVATHGDHRIAMAHLVLGLASEQPVIIDRADMIATSFPAFAPSMRAIGGDVAEAA